MNVRHLALAALPAALAVGAIGIAVPAQAVAPKTVVVNGHCSGTSRSNLQLQRESRTKLSVDFGVDMVKHTPGVKWKITETDNGTGFVKTSKLTIADGSFSITRLIVAQPGTNTIVANATNPATGETCTISATI